MPVRACERACECVLCMYVVFVCVCMLTLPRVLCDPLETVVDEEPYWCSRVEPLEALTDFGIVAISSKNQGEGKVMKLIFASKQRK